MRGFGIVSQSRYAGTGDDLSTWYTLDGGPVTSVPWGGETLSMSLGQSLAILHDSPGGDLHFAGQFVVYGSLVATPQAPFLAEPFPGIHIDFAGIFVVFPGLAGGIPLFLAPGGYGYGFTYPGGLPGSSIVLQAAVSSNETFNGIFASSHGLRIDFN